MGNDELSINVTRLLEYLKSSDNYCPRKLFSGSNSSPEKSLQKNRSIFGLKNQSCDRRKGGAEIAFEIRAERSSPRNESGTNCRGSAGNSGGFAKHLTDTACFWLVLLTAFCWTIERS